MTVSGTNPIIEVKAFCFHVLINNTISQCNVDPEVEIMISNHSCTSGNRGVWFAV